MKLLGRSQPRAIGCATLITVCNTAMKMCVLTALHNTEIQLHLLFALSENFNIEQEEMVAFGTKVNSLSVFSLSRGDPDPL